MIKDSMSIQATNRRERVAENEMSQVSSRLSIFDKGRKVNDGAGLTVTNKNKINTDSKVDDPSVTTKPSAAAAPSAAKRNKVAMKYWDVIKKHQKAQSVLSALKAPRKKASVDDGQSSTPQFLQHREKFNSPGLSKATGGAAVSGDANQDASTTTATDTNAAEPTEEAEEEVKKRPSLKSAMGKSTGKDLWKILKKKNRTRTIIQKMLPTKPPEFQQVVLQSTGQLDELKKGGKDQYLEKKKEQKSQLSEKDTVQTKQLLNSRRSSLARVNSFSNKDEKQKRRSSLYDDVIEEEDEAEMAKAHLRHVSKSKSPVRTSGSRHIPLDLDDDPNGLFQNKLKSVPKTSSRTVSMSDMESDDVGFKLKPTRYGSMADLGDKASGGKGAQLRSLGSASAHARTDLSKRSRNLPTRHCSFDDVQKNLKFRKSDADRAVLDVSNLRNSLRPSKTKEYRKEEVVVDNRHVLLTKKPTFGIFLKGLIPTEPGMNEYTTAPIDEGKAEEFSGFDLEIEPLLDGKEQLETETGEIVDLDDSHSDNASDRRRKTGTDGSDDDKSMFEVRLRCIKKEQDNSDGPFNPFEVSYQINLKNRDKSADSKGGKSNDYFELELRPMKQRMLKKVGQKKQQQVGAEAKDDKSNSVQVVLRHIADPTDANSTMTATESMMEVPLPSLESMVGKENKAPLFEVDLEHMRCSQRGGRRGGRQLEGSKGNTDFRGNLRKSGTSGSPSQEKSDDSSSMGKNFRSVRASRSKTDNSDSQLTFKLRKTDPDDPSGKAVSETTFDIKLNGTTDPKESGRRKEFGKYRQASFEMKKLRKSHLESLDEDGDNDDLDASNDGSTSSSSAGDVKLESIKVYEEKAILVEEPEGGMRDMSLNDTSWHTSSIDSSANDIPRNKVFVNNPARRYDTFDKPEKRMSGKRLSLNKAPMDDASMNLKHVGLKASRENVAKEKDGMNDLNSKVAVKPDNNPAMVKEGSGVMASEPERREETCDKKDSSSAVGGPSDVSQKSESMKARRPSARRSSNISMGIVDENSPLVDVMPTDSLHDPSDGGSGRTSDPKTVDMEQSSNSGATSGSSVRVENFTRRRHFLDDSSDDDSSSYDGSDSEDEASDQFGSHRMNSSMPAMRKKDAALARSTMLQKSKHASFRQDMSSSSIGGSVHDNLRLEAENRLQKQQERMERRRMKDQARMSVSSNSATSNTNMSLFDGSMPSLPNALIPYYATPSVSSPPLSKIPDQYLDKKPESIDLPSVESEVEELRRKCYMWYARLGAPTRKKMKSKVKVLASSCDITVDDVDLLPWDEKGLVVNVPEMTELFMNA